MTSGTRSRRSTSREFGEQIVRRIIGAILAGLLAMSGVFATATPAAAWSYCSTSGAPVAVIILYDNQGYCGTLHSWYPTANQCIYLDSPEPGNWAGSVWNRTPYSIILYSNTNCTGDLAGVYGYTSHPNLYAIDGQDLGNRVSSIFVGN